MPKLSNEKIIEKFRERFDILKERGKVENVQLTDAQIIMNYEMMEEIQDEKFQRGELKNKNVLRETLELFKTGRSSYWQLKSSQKIATNLLNSGYEFTEEQIMYLESVQKGRQSANFRRRGRQQLFNIVEEVNEWFISSSDDENIERQARYAIFGS